MEAEKERDIETEKGRKIQRETEIDRERQLYIGATVYEGFGTYIPW